MVESLDEKRVFYQFNIKYKVSVNEIILSKDKSFRFYDLIECICERTGAHIQKGDIFFKGFKIPENIYNHEIYDFLISSIK